MQGEEARKDVSLSAPLPLVLSLPALSLGALLALLSVEAGGVAATTGAPTPVWSMLAAASSNSRAQQSCKAAQLDAAA